MGGFQSVWELIGLVGVISFFAGIHLMWQSREEMLYWLDEYFRLLRMSFRRVADPGHAPLLMLKQPPEKRHTLRIVVGVVLAFVAGPMLFSLGLALLWMSRHGD